MSKKEILCLIIIVAIAVIAVALILLVVICIVRKRRLTRTSAKNRQETSEAATVRKVAAVRHTGKIIGYSGRCNGKEVEMKDGERISLGRNSKECQIVVNGAKVSRVHCRIAYQAQDDCYLVKDCSANGTFLMDGGRISSDRYESVPSGTCICLGNREQIFQLGDPS